MENNWNDVSGNGRNGIVVGNPNFSSSSKLGSYAGNFAGGSGNYVYFGSTSTVNISDAGFSVALWLKTTVGGALISKGSGVGQAGGFTVNTDGSGYLQVYLKDTNGGQAALLSGTVPLTDGLWHHLVVSFNTSTTTSGGNNIVAYLDGMAHGTISRSGYFFGGTTLDSITVGARGAPVNGPSSFYAGLLDDVAVFSTNLTQAQAQTIYARQSSKYSGQLTSRVLDAYSSQSWTTLASTTTLPFYKELPGSAGSESSASYSSVGGSLITNLEALWRMNEPIGTTGPNTLLDSSGNLYHATPSGTINFGKSGVFGTSAEFPGVDATVNTTNLKFAGTASFSSSVWIKTSATSGFFNILNPRAADGNGQQGWILYLYGVDGKVRIARTVNSAETQALAPTAVNDGKWHHVATTYNGSTSKIYIDGVLGNAQSDSTSILGVGSTFYIGGSSQTGSIDEVGIWSRALNASEIKELYRRGANRLKYQLRSCSASDCSDQDALTTTYKGWKGPDNTGLSYFSELYNTTSNVLAGTVSTGSPNMTFSNFSGTGLSVTANRYFQYRAILESDDHNTLCNYGSGAVACSPELQSVAIGDRFHLKCATQFRPSAPVNFMQVHHPISS